MPKRKNPKPPFEAQPSNAAVLKLLQRPKGASLAELVKARGVQAHTLRAVISRLESVAGIKVGRTKEEKRGLVYRVRS